MRYARRCEGWLPSGQWMSVLPFRDIHGWLRQGITQQTSPERAHVIIMEYITERVRPSVQFAQPASLIDYAHDSPLKHTLVSISTPPIHRTTKERQVPSMFSSGGRLESSIARHVATPHPWTSMRASKRASATVIRGFKLIEAPLDIILEVSLPPLQPRLEWQRSSHVHTGLRVPPSHGHPFPGSHIHETAPFPDVAKFQSGVAYRARQHRRAPRLSRTPERTRLRQPCVRSSLSCMVPNMVHLMWAPLTRRSATAELPCPRHA